MNKKILNTNIESMLFFDAEMVSQNKELDTSSKQFEMYQWKYRDKVNDELLEDDEVVDLYKRKAALNPIYNKIVCISVAFVKDGVCYYKAFTGSEKEITESFYNILQKGNYILVSCNGIQFDIPNIRIAALRSGCKVECPDKYSDSLKKSWNVTDHHIDLMDAFKGTYYYNFSLDEICYLMDIESPKDGDVKGKGLSEYYYENGLGEIPEYCNKDTVALVQIVAKLQGIFEGLTYEDRTDKSIDTKEVSVLERIYLANQITEEDKKEILDILGRKKLTKKAKGIIIDMLYNLSLNSDFMNKDKKEVKEEKLKLVEDLINNL